MYSLTNEERLVNNMYSNRAGIYNINDAIQRWGYNCNNYIGPPHTSIYTATSTAIDSAIEKLARDTLENSNIIENPFDLMAKINHRLEEEKIMKVLEIKDIDIIKGKDGNPKVIIVTFNDNTKTKAVCSEDDTFDFELGINICMMKKIYGKGYYKFIKAAQTKYQNKIKKQEEEKEKAERIKAKRAKNIAKKQQRDARRREDNIEMQKEAYIRAMKEINNESKKEKMYL